MCGDRMSPVVTVRSVQTRSIWVLCGPQNQRGFSEEAARGGQVNTGLETRTLTV